MEEQAADDNVPPFFICPISLEIMRDPVTISTGITYDRDSIESWLSDSTSDGKCPVTKLPISGFHGLTPNRTLQRLIQSWYALNDPRSIVPMIINPRAQIGEILNGDRSPRSRLKCLSRLRSITSALTSTNTRLLEEAGAVHFLADIIISASEEIDSSEALSILLGLQLSEARLKALIGLKNGEFIDSLIRVIQCGSCESRVRAVMLLQSMFEIADPMQMMFLGRELFAGVARLLHDHRASLHASKTSLSLLIRVIPHGRNRIKAVEAGLVHTLIELLLDSSSDIGQWRLDEMRLVLLEMMCQCADGRAELLNHGAGLAILSKKVLRVSHVGSQRAVKILRSVSKYSATPAVLQEMLQVGVVAKMCLVLQVDCGKKTKEKAKEILRRHAGAWRGSPCIPPDLLASYTSSTVKSHAPVL
ncbi:hypothetical protein SAY86_005833 [Trapa natans]|uniref:U-box domain-containing protein n=1 Tax=Trapa natans TaxID=22666 RepID=A0AAN7L8Q8_TRANT|nr:hypothetical protein SAY86_005833 [Trapa natans]